MKKMIRAMIRVMACIAVCFIFTACSGSSDSNSGGGKVINQKCADFVSASEFMACDKVSQAIDKKNFIVNEGESPPKIDGHYLLNNEEFYIDNWIAMFQALGVEFDSSSNVFSTGSGNLFTAYVETGSGSASLIYLLSGEMLNNGYLIVELLEISKDDYQAVLTKAKFILVEKDNEDVDSDHDGIPDNIDNCPNTPNHGQIDYDNDGVGDVCDVTPYGDDIDSDGDSIPDNIDNCPNTPNPDQNDSDNDGVGDVCEEDSDGDGVVNDIDNCPNTPNPDQIDSDNDGVGDVCEEDSDGDSVINDIDNCPNTPNPDQIDSDNDGVGDVCEEDSDGDGVINDIDNCPNTPNPDQIDSDNDGVGDVCEEDSDGDGVVNDIDNCPNTPNPDQIDSDNDGVGDACDLINNDGSTKEKAKLLINNAEAVQNAPSYVAWYKFEGKAGWKYEINSYLADTDLTNQDMILYTADGQIRGFSPDATLSAPIFGRPHGACIGNWFCPADGTYYIKIIPDAEGQGDYTIKINGGEYVENPGANRDKFEPDDEFLKGNYLVLNEKQIKTSYKHDYFPQLEIDKMVYDYDWLFFHVIEGRSYKFKLINVSNTDLVFSGNGRDGNLLFNEEANSEGNIIFVYTADRTDFIVLRTVSWILEKGEYTIEVVPIE